MSSASLDSSHSPSSSHTPMLERPLIVAAYRYGDPLRKRRVKVPLNISWRDFLGLVYSRLNINPESEIEIYDEQGIEIVSVEDLVENDVLVIRDRRPKLVPLTSQGLKDSSQMTGRYESRGSSVETRNMRPSVHIGPNPHLPTRKETGSSNMGSLAVAKTTPRSRDQLERPPSTMGVAQLAHFIQSNSFGYYFLAEVDNMKILPSHGKIKRTHCIVKVPHLNNTTGSFQTFECEANLLRKISGHKCIISAPTIQILNFSDEVLQRFLSTVPSQKQLLLRDLFVHGGCTEAYVYPLYGVTMATKIKAGLTPDKALKYAFQLADIMNYLQQKGVIHQNLLPENIQVMSNDRAMLCNFETAIQADPSSCLLVVSRSVITPSNKKGLAPEVISAFARVEMETVDFSTQYPWSFGVLAVLMSTGQHPLKDYPGAYEVGGARGGPRVKYRSANYQALPDPNKYPSSFCKLVRRSLSCDQSRRPSILQILQVMKRDRKIVSLLTGRRAGGEDGRAMSGGDSAKAQVFERDPSLIGAGVEMVGHRGGEVGDPYYHAQHNPLHPQRHSYSGLSSSLPSALPYHRSTSGTFLADRSTDRIKRSKMDQRSPYDEPRGALMRSYDAHVRSHDPPLRSHDTSLRSHDPSLRLHDPLMGPQVVQSDPLYSLLNQEGKASTSSGLKPWLTFEDSTSSPLGYHSQTGRELRTSGVRPRDGPEGHLGLQRYGSQGAFSDDFVVPGLPRGSAHSILQQGGGLEGDRYLDSSGSQTMLTGPRQAKGSCTTSESDLSQLQEFHYERLMSSPSQNAAVLSDRDGGYSPSTYRGDRDRLLRVSSPELGQDIIGVQGFPRNIQEFTNGMQGFPRNIQEFTNGMQDLAAGVQRSAGSMQEYTVSAQRYPSAIHGDAQRSSSASDETMDESITTATDDHTPEPAQATSISRNQTYETATDGNFGGQSPIKRPNTSPQGKGSMHEGAALTVGRPVTEPLALVASVSQRVESSQEMDTESMTTGRSQSHDSHLTMSQDAPMSQEDQSRASTVEMDTATTSDQSQPTEVATTLRGGERQGEGEEGERAPVFQVGGSLEEDDRATGTIPLMLPRSDKEAAVRDTVATSVASHSPSVGPAQSSPYTFTLEDSLNFTPDTAEPLGSHSAAAGGDGASHSQPIGDDMDTPKVSRVTRPQHQIFPEAIFQIPPLGAQGEIVPGDEELTPKQTQFDDEERAVREDGSGAQSTGPTVHISSENRATLHASQQGQHQLPNENAQPRHMSSSTTNQMPALAGGIQANQRAYAPVSSGGGLGYMSPIPEASQECSSQTQTTTDRLSSSQKTQSAISPEEEVLRRSISPFRHSALDDRASTPQSQSTTSEHGSTAQASTVTALTALRIQLPPTAETRSLHEESLRLEPPSSDTSHSTTISSSLTSGEVSTRAQVSSPQPTPLPLPLPPPPRHNRRDNQLRPATDTTSPVRVQTRASSEVRVQGTRGATPARSNVSAPARVGVYGSLSPHSTSQLSGSGLSPSSGSLIGVQVQPEGEVGNRLTDYPRAHRISQDLEMMNLAISGMDSQSSGGNGSQGRLSDSNSRAPPESHSYPRMPELSSSHAPSPQIPQPVRVYTPSSRPTEPARTFRPITPTVGELRSISAGPMLMGGHQDDQASNRHPTPSGVHDRGGRGSVPPPQVAIDSYDYLPPYSPPQDRVNENMPPVAPNNRPPSSDHYRVTRQQQQQEQSSALYPEAPPSYEDIFGPRQTNGHRQRRSKFGYSASRQRVPQNSLELRRAISSGNATSGAGRGGAHRGLTRQGSGQRKLPSLTNLFRRSRSRQSQDLSPSNPIRGGRSRVPVANEADHTASWVASYSHTPRPQVAGGANLLGYGVPSGGRDNMSVVSSGSLGHYSQAPSRVSHAVSDTTSSRPRPSRNPPVPYINPPPFPSVDLPDSPTPPVARHPGSIQSQGIISNSTSNIPADVRSTPPASRQAALHGYSSRGRVMRRAGTHDRHIRPRPYSEIMASEDVEIFQPSSGLEQREVRAGARNLSSSCFDIMGQTHSGLVQNELNSAGVARPSSGLPFPVGSTIQHTHPRTLPASSPSQNLSDNANGNNMNAVDNTSPCVSPTPHDLPLSNTSSSQTSSVASQTNSSRVNARIRAVSRRAQQSSQYSSSDDDVLERQTRAQVRVRRRRGHDGQRAGHSQSPEAQVRSPDQAAASHDTRLQSPDAALALTTPSEPVIADDDAGSVHIQPNESHDQGTSHSTESPLQADIGGSETADMHEEVAMEAQTQVTVEEQCPTNPPTDVIPGPTEGPTPLSAQPEMPGMGMLTGSSKSCGHRCVSVPQDLCCLCTKTQQGPLEITRLLQNCHVCERRTAADDSGPHEPLSGCVCHGNKMSLACPVHYNRRYTLQSTHQQDNGASQRTGKHCVVM